MRGTLSRETCLIVYRNDCFGPRVIGCTEMREGKVILAFFYFVCKPFTAMVRGFLLVEAFGREENRAMRSNSYCFFENRECEYFPCHERLEDFNCLFCYCPLYSMEKCPGEPRYIEREGQRIKECTYCTYPHQPENYETIIRILGKQRSK